MHLKTVFFYENWPNLRQALGDFFYVFLVEPLRKVLLSESTDNEILENQREFELEIKW